MKFSPFALGLILFLPACDSAEPDICMESPTVVSPDDDRLGFSADDVLAQLPETGEAEWASGGASALFLDFERVGDPVVYETCGASRLELEVEVGLATEDGALDVAYRTTVFREEGGTTQIVGGLFGTDDVHGTVPAVPDFPPPGYQLVGHDIVLDLDGLSWVGLAAANDANCSAPDRPDVEPGCEGADWERPRVADLSLAEVQ